MRREGFADAIDKHANRGGLVLGICGGCQMLGEAIEDPYGIESHEPFAQGLGLLPLSTRFKRKKSTARVSRAGQLRMVRSEWNAPEITGYEIHMGSVTPTDADWKSTRGRTIPERPLVCLAETSKQLIMETREPIP